MRIWRMFKQMLFWGIFALILLQGWFFAHILWWRTNPPPYTAFMRQRAAETPGLHIQYTWVSYNQISPHLKRALIAAEDAHFLSHQGFDWEGIRMAYERNQRRGHISAGGSTISQQLAKKPLPKWRQKLCPQSTRSCHHTYAREFMEQNPNSGSLCQRH